MDFKDEAQWRQQGGAGAVVGGQLLDWRRCLGLFLWYASPSEEYMKLPPEGMAARQADMFADPETKLHLSLQGAIQYYLSKCWESCGKGKAMRNDEQTVPHPWPAYLEAEHDAHAQPLHLLRKLVHAGPDTACARMPPAVRSRLGWSRNERPRMPGASCLCAPPSAVDGVDEAWEGWAVDVRMELSSLLFPTGRTGDASLPRLLETECNSLLGFDAELSWHLHEILVRLAQLGATGGKSAGRLAHRLAAQMHSSGHLLTQRQRAMLAHQFAEQLEMAGAWQAAAYVLLSLAPAPSAHVNMSSGGERDQADADARLMAAQALRALIARRASLPDKHDAVVQEPVIHVPQVCTLTVDVIAQRLQERREAVLSWFLQSQAWRIRYQAPPPRSSSSASVRRLGAGRGLDRELDLCMRSGEWLRANHLVLALITPADLPDPSVSDEVPQHTLHLLRKVHAGLASFRRSHEWCVHTLD